MHTLVLVGELNRTSAPALEAEIERAYEAGATGITLDLARLTQIDVSGVAVVLFRRGWCERRDCPFSVIGEPPFVRRAFERAGAIEALPFVAPDEALLLVSPITSEEPAGEGARKAPLRSSSVLHMTGERSREANTKLRSHRRRR